MSIHIDICSVKLIRKPSAAYGLDDRVIRKSEDAYGIIERLFELSSKTQTHFGMMSLNARNQCVGLHAVHTGSVAPTLIHPREVFQQAILNNATGVIVFHNHPSGNPEPSHADRLTTKRLYDAGLILGIELLDHIIVGASDYVSLKDRGYISLSDQFKLEV